MATKPQKPLAWLRSQGLGVICGLSTVLLLAIGSLFIAWNRDTVYADLSLDDIQVFFDQPHWMHGWFYLLLPVMTLYGVNTALCTYDSVLEKWRLGIRSPFRYGAAFMHLSFLIAMVAHLIGGLGSEEGEPVMLGVGWTEVVNGYEARVLGVEMETYPNRMPRRIDATVEVRSPEGDVETTIVGFNQPLSFGFGHELGLFANWGMMPQVANIVVGEEACALTEGSWCEVGRHRIGLVQLSQMGRDAYAADVSVTTDGNPSGAFMVGTWRPRALSDGAMLHLRSVEQRPALLVRRRTAPGNPWALASALALALGIVFLGRKWLP